MLLRRIYEGLRESKMARTPCSYIELIYFTPSICVCCHEEAKGRLLNFFLSSNGTGEASSRFRSVQNQIFDTGQLQRQSLQLFGANEERIVFKLILGFYVST